LGSIGGSDYLLEDVAIPGYQLLAALGSIAIHLIILISLGCVLVLLRDFA
jgi:hypothetical protein